MQEWNKDVKSVDNYLLSPEGMKNLAATCILIEAINESLLPLQPEIPWSQVMGMRNHIAYGYFDIDAEIVFQTVQKNLSPLLKAIRLFINHISGKI
ncbi:MAG: DUF86 domain-containing protein [Bacteroides sp.]|nr:DUF86 domain-containing protein [Bacteroides sp.]